MGWCTKGLARIFMFVANFYFLLVGLAMLVIGVLYIVNYHKYDEAIPEQYDVIQYVPTILIIIGAMVFLLAVLGCCGTLKCSTSKLTSYGAIAIVFIILLLLVGLGIFASVTIRNKDDLRQEITTAIDKLFARYDNDKVATEAVDAIQKSVKCCGTMSSAYWTTIPDSCAPESYATGCEGAMYDFILISVKVIAIVALTFSIIQVVGAVLALCLYCIRGRAHKEHTIRL